MSDAPDADGPKKPPIRRKKRMSDWAQCLLLAIGSYAFAALFYWLLQEMEQSDSSFRVEWYIAILYTLGGKWLVAGVFGLIGTFFLVAAITSLFPRRK